ncbi:MAG: NAD(+) diphosphatase [Pseudomonadota bacterium]
MADPIITFAQSSFDRAAHLREDPGGVARLFSDHETRVLPVWRGKPLMDISGTLGLAWLDSRAEILREAVEDPVFLGIEAGRAHFAIDVSAWEDPDADRDALANFVDRSTNTHPSLAAEQKFVDLRSAMGDLDGVDAGNAAAAKGILEWHRTHPRCARCGAPTDMAKGGWQRRCGSCGASHFPRTDPVVIMLITHGNDVLLGRSPGWPEGMYSLLAGFMEPGETIEAAVRREVMEEASVPVGDVGYLASQPWPFPSSLMIGCSGEALAREITLDPVELEDAIWVSRERCMAAMAGNDPTLLPARKGAIARSLLEMWLRGEA